MSKYNYLIENAKKEGVEKHVVGAIILNEKNEVLIMSRKVEDFMGGIDELPSGNMEKNETIEMALKREVKEETHLELQEIICYINSFDYISGSGKKARQYNFLVITKSGDIKLTEHDEYKWQDIDQIEENNNITNEVKECIKLCLNIKNKTLF